MQGLTCLVYAQEKSRVQSVPSFHEQLANVFMPFDGAWLPNIDPSLIGARNYKTLKNMRYVDTGLEGMNGYSLINTTIIDNTYYRPWLGYHFKKEKPSESHIFLQAYNYNLGQSKVYRNIGTIPDQADFEDVAITDESYDVNSGSVAQKTGFKDSLDTAFMDSLSTGWKDVDTTETITYTTYLSRFSPAPRDHVAYCNSSQSMIWGGNETQVAAVLTASAGVTDVPLNHKDYTEKLRNGYSDADNVMRFSAAGATVYWLVASTRPLNGVTHYISSANTSTGHTVYGKEWSGVTWTNLTVTDGTKGLTQTGMLSFSSTASTSKAKYLDGQILYWYVFECLAANATIYKVTVSAPWQTIKDVWDGVPRTCLSFQVMKPEGEKDYTLEVAQPSSDLYPIGAELGALQGPTHSAIAVFQDRLQGIYFKMLTGNTESMVAGLTVYYHDGSDWQAYTSSDDSKSGTTPLANTGVISWTPVSAVSEFTRSIYGTEGYAYKIEWEGVMGGTGAAEDAVIIDLVYGLPAPLDVKNFKFPVFYGNRLMLAGYLKGDEGNRVDFCAANSPDVWNGVDTSDNGRQSLYFGNGGELTTGIQLYNRLGSNVYNNLLMFEKNKMYMLTGRSPSGDNKFEIQTVSDRVGCPAIRTLTIVEVGYEMVQDELLRNLAVWLSSTGPMQFDLSVLQPIKGVDNYFTPNHADYVGADEIEDAFAWYDPNYKEWNLIVAGKWLTYNFIKRKWSERDVGTAQMPQCAFPVEDGYGGIHIYGGIDTGYMIRLENGYDWNGTAIDYEIETGDFSASDNAWHTGLIRRLKLAYKSVDEDTPISMTYYQDSATSGTSLWSIPMNYGTSGKTVRQTKMFDLGESWIHRFKFTSQTTNTNKGFQPVGWGYQHRVIREDD